MLLQILPDDMRLKERLVRMSYSLPSRDGVPTEMLGHRRIASALHRDEWSLVLSPGEITEP